MNNYIADLLNTNSRVIIPELGAFIVKQKNPKVIVFNEFLRYNDGLLIDYVAAKEQLEKDAAKEKVLAFVKTVNEKLSKGEELIIEGLGRLVKESSGKINFIEGKGAGESKDSRPKKPAQKEVKKESIAETSKEPVTESKNEPETPDNKMAAASSETTVSFEISEKKVDKKAESIPEEAKTEQAVRTENNKVKEKTPEKPATEKPKQVAVGIKKVQSPDKASVETAYEKPAGKSNRNVIIWILAILLVNGAIVGWFLYNDKIVGWFRKSESPVEVLPEPTKGMQDKTVQQNELTEDEIIPEPEPEIPHQVQPSAKKTPSAKQVTPATYKEKKYYIVAGCFRDETNADALVRELRKKGFNAEKFGKLGNLHAVSFASFIDKASATEELKKVRDSQQPEAWIVYY